jgi:hypothetical protein
MMEEISMNRTRKIALPTPPPIHAGATVALKNFPNEHGVGKVVCFSSSYPTVTIDWGGYKLPKHLPVSYLRPAYQE